MELIDMIEPAPRGPYCGSIGRIDASGDAAFNVAIRTLRLSPPEAGKGRAVLGVGSAIVADSHGMDEWRECLVKGGFVRQSTPDAQAADFDLIETMRFCPEQGIELLELHLERMKASATELGFEFDRHAARNMVQALCFDLEAPARVRLLLARSGATTLEAAPLTEGALQEPVRCGALPLPVDPGDWRLRHKCTDRGFYEAAHAAAAAHGASEAILVAPDGCVTEASRANIFVERDGMLLTPRASTGLLPGVLRRSLIELGKAQEADLTLEDLADGFLLGNSVRGLMQAEVL
jgi:para-aminobenzoate synthetase/4-amino-4-deoxychorismate lyase